MEEIKTTFQVWESVWILHDNRWIEMEIKEININVTRNSFLNVKKEITYKIQWINENIIFDKYQENNLRETKEQLIELI